MLEETLMFVRDELNAHMQVHASAEPAARDIVTFIDGDDMDPVKFTAGAVSLLLVNVEQERLFRAPDPYSRPSPDGGRIRVHPDIRMNLFLLFVARYKQYAHAWGQLSRIIQYFQAHPILDGDTMPTLPEGVTKLVFELMSLEFADQNELWNSLRTTAHPALLYRVKLVAFHDQPAVQPPAITRTQTQIELVKEGP